MDDDKIRKAEDLRGSERDILLACARMPFASAEALANTISLTDRAGRTLLQELKSLGFVNSFFWQARRGGSENKWFITADGVRAVAHLAGRQVGDVMKALPVSRQWQQRILSRIDAADIFYQIAGIASLVTYGECIWHWRGSGWMAGDLDIGNGRVMQVAWMGPTVSRRAVQHRMGSMMQDVDQNHVYGVIIVAADYVQTRLIERWIRFNARHVYVWVVNEMEIRDRWEGRIWSRPVWLGLQYHDSKYVFENALVCSDGAYEWAMAPYGYKRGAMPNESAFEGRMEFEELNLSARALLCAMLDWPLAEPEDLFEMCDVRRSTGYENASQLVERGLAGYVTGYGPSRLGVMDEGLRLMGVRDQTQVAELRRLWAIRRRAYDDGFEPVGGSIKKLADELGSY